MELFFYVGVSALFSLFLLYAFFSLSETALFSLSELTVKRLQEEKGKRGQKVAALLNNPRRLIITLVMGIMLVNVAASSLASFMASKLLGSEGLALAIGLMTFLILIFCEVIPKNVALLRAESLALFVAPLVDVFAMVFFPIRIVLRKLMDSILAYLSEGPLPESLMTEEELKTAVYLGRREGLLDKEEEEMIKGVLEMSRKRVRDIMRPRLEIVALDLNTPGDQMLATIKEKGLSRLPVYEENLENIVGILHVHDLLAHPDAYKSPQSLKRILKQPLYVPDSKQSDSLLREFLATKRRMALVVDEHGAIDGLITLEDLLEEILGEVIDKKDVFPLYQWIDPSTIRVSARIELDEFNELFNTQLKDETCTTLGGFILKILGRIPIPGECFEHESLIFKIASAHKTRIEELIVCKKKEGVE